MADENLTNFLIRLSIDDTLLNEYAAANDAGKKVILERENLSPEAVSAILQDDDVKVRDLSTVAIIQFNQAADED